MEFSIRAIKKEDDAEIERIIRYVLTEHGLNRPGTAYYDESLQHMYASHTTEKSIYFIVESKLGIIGGGGVYPTQGLASDTCELIKMYLLPEARGHGIGKSLLDHCIAFAQQKGYKKMYLETFDELKRAIYLYEQNGFHLLTGPLGNTGHYACGIRMMKNL